MSIRKVYFSDLYSSHNATAIGGSIAKRAFSRKQQRVSYHPRYTGDSIFWFEISARRVTNKIHRRCVQRNIPRSSNRISVRPIKLSVLYSIRPIGWSARGKWERDRLISSRKIILTLYDNVDVRILLKIWRSQGSFDRYNLRYMLCIFCWFFFFLNIFFFSFFFHFCPYTRIQSEKLNSTRAWVFYFNRRKEREKGRGERKEERLLSSLVAFSGWISSKLVEKDYRMVTLVDSKK